VAPIEAAAARERIETGRPPQGKFPEGQAGQTRDKVGAFAGVSGRTVEKIAKVVEAAEREPAKFAPLVAEMDRTGKVNGAYRKLRQAEDEERVGRIVHIQENPPPGALDLKNSSADACDAGPAAQVVEGGQDRANVIPFVEPEIAMLEDQRFDDTPRDLNEEARRAVRVHGISPAHVSER
jgi:hypothetical protein